MAAQVGEIIQRDAICDKEIFKYNKLGAAGCPVFCSELIKITIFNELHPHNRLWGIRANRINNLLQPFFADIIDL